MVSVDYFDAFALVFEEIKILEDCAEMIGIFFTFFPGIAGYGHVRCRHFFGAAGHARMAFEQLGALAKYNLEMGKNIDIICVVLDE